LTLLFSGLLFKDLKGAVNGFWEEKITSLQEKIIELNCQGVFHRYSLHGDDQTGQDEMVKTTLEDEMQDNT